MTDEFVVGGVRDIKSCAWVGGKTDLKWSFSAAELAEEYIVALDIYEVAPLPDHLVARVPEAADALVRWLTIRKLRAETVEQPSGYLLWSKADPRVCTWYDASGNPVELGVCGGDCSCG